MLALGLLNSSVMSPFLDILSPKDFNPGSLKIVPVLPGVLNGLQPEAPEEQTSTKTTSKPTKSGPSEEFKEYMP